jgi:hypothetical protein
MQQRAQQGQGHRGANFGGADGEHTRVKDFLDHLDSDGKVTKRQTYQELLLIQQEMKTRDLELQLERELRRQAQANQEVLPVVCCLLLAVCCLLSAVCSWSCSWRGS